MKERDINIEGEEVKTDNMSVEEPADEVAEQEMADAETEEASADMEVADDVEVAEVTDPLEAAQAEIADLKDQLLRKVAEFDNFRKRTIKEKAELILNGGKKVITSLFPVIDDMERALQNGAKTDDPEVLREGMKLIYQKMMKILESQGVTKIDTTDADFDTNLHEAIAMVPGVSDDKKGKVVDCVATGYKLNDEVIRFAKVAVGQ